MYPKIGNMKKTEITHLIEVETDNRHDVTLQVCKQKVVRYNGAYLEKVVVLSVGATLVILTEYQAEQMARKLRELNKVLNQKEIEL